MRERNRAARYSRLDADLSLHVLKKHYRLRFATSGETFYFADTWTGEICARDYNTATGDLSGERVFCHVDRSRRRRGGRRHRGQRASVWNALVYAGKLVRYTPEEQVDRVIEMPVKKVTSVMFGSESAQCTWPHVTSMAQPPTAALPGR
ncbi:SMP-30/gluconolactonase/LRE family protein [Klebsiella pneumoniae]|nr:SMP-30/gluconolactonase/LRE family protein [Klebsiella pneumoniae]